MVKSMFWADRAPGLTANQADACFRDHLLVDLPPVLPVEAWKREGVVVEICTEKFPGAEPIWLWSLR